MLGRLGRIMTLGASMMITSAMATSALAQELTHPPVSMTTADPTGSWFPTGAAVADLANKQFDGQPISVTPGAGALGNISRVGTGRSDLGLSYGPFLKLATIGHNEINPGEGYENLRAIMSFTAYPLNVMVDEDLGLTSLDDLEEYASNLRIATGQTGSSNFFIFNVGLAQYGMNLEAIEEAGGTVRQANQAEISSAWNNRQINMLSVMFPPAHPAVAELMRVRNSELLGFSDEVLAQLEADLGFLSYEITPEHYKQQGTTIKTIGSPTVLFGDADLGDELVYQMTKQVAENKERMVQSVSSFENWSPEDMYKGLAIEIHPGALRYYRERGWIE